MPPKRKSLKRKSPVKRNKSKKRASPKAKEVLHAVTETMTCEMGSNGVPVCQRETKEIKCTQNKKGVVTCKTM